MVEVLEIAADVNPITLRIVRPYIPRVAHCWHGYIIVIIHIHTMKDAKSPNIINTHRALTGSWISMVTPFKIKSPQLHVGGVLGRNRPPSGPYSTVRTQAHPL